ncbi:E3 ubiquitin-protein ligase RSL1-like isoform X2 [Henckelia pumila]|uniref:E3 ubiquitin-protein ligase RSL1-like isoform X2 n=1 Tax=Henckelia pumila TaxID=405737 RepID=UPI003C6E42A6
MVDDADFAFSLQVEEALTASLIDGGAAPSATDDAVFGPDLAQLLVYDNLSNYEQELLDQYETQAVAKRTKLDLKRQFHDRAFASQISTIPEADWEKNGDNFNIPYGEGSSSSSYSAKKIDYVVHVKGLVEPMASGIGVAICDCNGVLVFEVSKGLSRCERQVSGELVEVKALVEGLDAAVMLGLNNIELITGKKVPKQANIAALVEQMNLLLRKFNHVRSSLVSTKDLKFAFELARKAVSCQVNRTASNREGKSTTETCAICFEVTRVDQMFQITDCLHSYCFSCMSKHVEVKLQNGTLPKCPSENCRSELKLGSCKKFLTPKLFEIMSERMKEARIPADEKIYCPYPRCSTLLSKTDFQGSSKHLTVVICPKCSGNFCINCKVPWHRGMTCHAYQSKNPSASREDEKLKSLASKKLWRQCPKCNHMVSLAEGCYHIYCRCRHEFCYTCGAEWREKKPTCKCPIWDVRNIIHDERNR